MNPKLLDRLIETSIDPIAKWSINGEVLSVKITKPDTSNEELERLQRGVKFDCHINSPNIVQNLEYYGIIIDGDVRSDIIKEIRGEQAKASKENLIDARGTKFDPQIYETDGDGKPLLTKFKTFKRKVAKPIAS